MLDDQLVTSVRWRFLAGRKEKVGGGGGQGTGSGGGGGGGGGGGSSL